MSISTRSTRCCSSRRTACAPSSASITSRPKDCNISAPIMRLTMLSSTSSTTPDSGPLPSSVAKSESCAGGSGARGRLSVKRKRDPAPTRLSTSMRPPMASMMRWLIASPRPVPPRSRELVLSTWWKGWNTRSSAAVGMPMPVSSTTKCRRT